MTLTRRVGIVLALVIATVVLYATHLGLFVTITVTQGVAGPFTFVYREMHGSDMSQVGAITTALDNALARAGIAQRQPLDAFFPDGRAEIGFAVAGTSADTLATIGPDTRQRTLPARPALVAEFPRRNRLSFIVGAAKVDKAFADYRASHGYAKTEAYALNTGATIRYFQWANAAAR